MKLKPTKSTYASGAPPCPVTIQGATKSLSRVDLYNENANLLILLAAMIEQNNGQTLVSSDSIETVKKKKRVLQIIPGNFGLTVQFDTYKESTIPSVPEESFDLQSEVAKEAREFLAAQKEKNDTN